MSLTLEELGLGGLGSLGGPGWYGTHAPVRSFREGVSRLGGGGLAKTKMRMIWSQRRPAGFWASRRGQGWKRVSPGNMTPAMLRALLREIQKYEDVSGTDPRWRVTPPGSHRRRPRPRAQPRPSPPRPRPRPTPSPATALLSSVARTRTQAPKPPRPVTGQLYARQARHGMPLRMATGAYTQPVSYMSMPR